MMTATLYMCERIDHRTERRNMRQFCLLYALCADAFVRRETLHVMLLCGLLCSDVC